MGTRTLNLDDVIIEDKPLTGGKIKSSSAPHQEPEDHGHTEGDIMDGGKLAAGIATKQDFMYHYTALKMKYPYTAYVDHVATTSNRPVRILYNNLRNKYHEFILSRIPANVTRPAIMPPTGKRHRDYKRLAPYSFVDMAADYMNGKPSTLDKDNYVLMNGHIMKLGKAQPIINYDAMQKYNSKLMPKTSPFRPDINSSLSDDVFFPQQGAFEQRFKLYNNNVNELLSRHNIRITADLMRDYFDTNVQAAVLENAGASFEIDLKHSEAYDKIFTILVRTRGTVVIDVPLSPVFPAYAAFKRYYQRFAGHRFVISDVTKLVGPTITEITPVASNAEFTTSVSNQDYSSYFLDGTVLKQSKVYSRILEMWKATDRSNSRTLVIASRNRLGNNLSDFYKIMGFNIFRELFGIPSDKLEEVRELFEEAVRGSTISVPFTKRSKNRMTVSGSTIAGDTDPPEDDDTSISVPPNEVVPPDEIVPPTKPPVENVPPTELDTPESLLSKQINYIRETPIYFEVDTDTDGNYLPTDPKNFNIGSIVAVRNIETNEWIKNPNKLDDVYIMMIHSRVSKTRNGESTPDKYNILVPLIDSNIKDLNTKAMFPEDINPKYALHAVKLIDLTQSETSVGKLTSSIVSIPDQQTIYAKGITSDIYKLYFEETLGMLWPEFYDVYDTQIAHIYAMQRKYHELRTIPNNGYVNVATGSGLRGYHKQTPHVNRAMHGGAIANEEQVRMFNPSNVTYLFETTFINGFPVYITEITG